MSLANMAKELAQALKKEIECPYGQSLAEVLALTKKGKLQEASRMLYRDNPYPLISLQMCNWEKYLQNGSLITNEVGEFLQQLPQAKQGSGKKLSKKIAVIGSGICGMTATKRLSEKGYQVSLYEALPKTGGYLLYAVPEFILSNDILGEEFSRLEEKGVKISTNQVIGTNTTLKELEKKYDALFLATGSSCPSFTDIPGQELANVYHGNEFLMRVNMLNAHKYPKFKTPLFNAKKTVVVGGGNIALYCARLAKKLGSDVMIVYRRSQNEMSAKRHEIDQAREEGIDFLEMTQPVEIKGGDRVESIELMQMMLEAEDERGRRTPVAIDDSEFSHEADQVILATGHIQNPVVLRNSDLRTGFGNKIIINENYQTSKENIFAGGDLVKPSNDIFDGIHSGQEAAENIHNHFQQQNTTNR